MLDFGEGKYPRVSSAIHSQCHRPDRSRDGILEGEFPLHVVVAVHGREVKTALFLALNSIPSIEIVATATSTAELTSYCQTFQPDAVIVERGVPGRPLTDVLRELDQSMMPRRVLVVETAEESESFEGIAGVETLWDVDHRREVLAFIEAE